MIALLILAAVVDALLFVLLIGVSGFVFGGGPEGMSGEPSAVAMWTLAVLACAAAPIIGFVLRSRGRMGAGATVAWVPPVIALLITFVPYHPY